MRADGDSYITSVHLGVNEVVHMTCVARWQPSSLIMVPELLKGLLMACRMGWTPPSSLSFIAVGGARVSVELLRQAARAGLPVYQGYGLSECASVVALSTLAPDAADDSVGRVLPALRAAWTDRESVPSGLQPTAHGVGCRLARPPLLAVV